MTNLICYTKFVNKFNSDKRTKENNAKNYFCYERGYLSVLTSRQNYARGQFHRYWRNI